MTARDLVEKLAQALDDDDYEAAGAVLAPNVTYDVGGDTIRGREAVLASYRRASEMAHELFDEVGYDHEVKSESSGRFRIHYGDVLTLAGEVMRHRAEQVVTTEPNRGIIHIEDCPVPGERERVDEFLERHGLSRDI